MWIQQIAHRRIWPGIFNKDFPAKGILEAHQQVVLFALNNDLPFIIIAEDDLRFSAKGAWNYYLSSLPEKSDMFLGGITWGDISSDSITFDFAGPVLYTIYRKFYRTFLSLQPGVDFDRQLAGKGDFRVCDPMVAYQQKGYSDNRQRKMDFSLYYEKYQWFVG